MKSFSILRTNVGLTTNCKIVIDNNYNISIDSIDSNDTLGSSRYKKFKVSEDSLLDEILPMYYRNTPSDIAFSIKYRNDSNTMSDDLNYQYDDIYNYGGRNIINNKNYSEEFEYFAPLYINPIKVPSNFIIFRCDNSGVKRISSNNFKSEIINKLKTVKVYDISEDNSLGKWINNNFVDNAYFPHAPLEIDFRSLEFNKWNGIDYKNGGYISKSKFMGDYFEEEKEIFDFEKKIFDTYSESEVIFPNILNFSFLFDDTPSTSENKRKWSLNTYYGFYIDSMDKSHSLSPYKTPILRDDVIIKEGNILYSDSNPNNPFVEKWSEEKPFYIEYNGEYYLISKYTNESGDNIEQVQSEGYIDELYQNKIEYNYKIISDISLEGKELFINKNYGVINENNEMLSEDNNNFEIDDFSSSDVWVIKIGDVYHNIIKTNDGYKINTDYSFEINKNFFEYKVNNNVKRLDANINFETPPLSFDIFKLNFTDIKDFDTNIVDTDFSKYEYEYNDKITNTDESKMYFENSLSTNNPKDNEEFFYKNEVVNIPVSSEYTANYETFKIKDGELSNIWRINPIYCRWGYQNSLASNDKPYLLNNSLLFEDYNRGTDVFLNTQNRESRNLDYFYSLNSTNEEYLHHSLHIEDYDENNDINKNFLFEENKYLNINSDYFTNIFERKQLFNNAKIKKNVKKYSYMNKGDDIIPNVTLFRGIEFSIYDVNSIIKNEENIIKNINLSTSNTFEDYKFSILLSNTPSELSWGIIKEWEMDKEYKQNNLVLFDDILYKAINDNIITEPVLENSDIRKAPYNSSDWEIVNEDVIFWNPDKSYNEGDIIYNSNKFYKINNSLSNNDIWNPILNYNIDDIVLFKSSYYISTITNNVYRPDNKKSYWEKTHKPNDTKWKEIELWNPSSDYGINTLIIHNERVYKSNESIEVGDEPGVSILWDEMYTFEVDNQVNDNTIFILNNNYYMLNENPNNENSLSNGINIYINKKWKNILLNIYINDNTLLGIKNTDRDELYSDIYNILTANNVINYINDINDKNGFVNNLKYIIIEENGDVNNYDYQNNIQNLPYLLKASFPDELKIKPNSLIKKRVETPNIKVDLSLSGSNIKSIDNINWYNGTPLAYEILNNETEPMVYKNYSGNKNIQSLSIYRYSGYYMPVFYEIDLFNKNGNKNYLFDTSLTNFALMKERKFRKVNRNGSILKLKNSKNNESIYPMIDEYGYSFEDFMIFKSTWDKEYHFESVLNKDRFKIKTQKNIESETLGQPRDVKIENEKKYKL